MPGDYKTFFSRFASMVPSRYLRRLVGKILGVDLAGVLASRAEAKDDNLGRAEAKVPRTTSMDNKTLNVPVIVQWQPNRHQGFIHSFINTIQHGPIMHQQSDRIKICKIIKSESSGVQSSSQSCKIYNSKILVNLPPQFL